MKSAVPLLCALAAMGELSWAQNVEACTRPAPVEFSLDPALAGGGALRPGAPGAVTAIASRNSGFFCRGDECTLNTCGSEAYLQLEFEPALDPRNSPGSLGYRLKFLDGIVPPELEGPLTRVFAGAPPLRVSLPTGFDAVVALDASFELVALDRGGHEGPGSEPFRLAFDACTHVVGLGGCAEDSSPPVTCTAAAGCLQAALESGSSGCALAPGRSFPPGVRGLSLAGVGLAACALGRRRRARTGKP